MQERQMMAFLHLVGSNNQISGFSNQLYLTLPVPIRDEKKKSTQFFFDISLWCHKRFYDIKPFEVPQRSVKIKF